MRTVLFILALTGALAAQTQSPDESARSKSQPAASTASSQSIPASNPKLAPPHSDRVDVSSLGEAEGESSSKDTQIDLSPPTNDAKEHPQSSEILMDGGGTSDSNTGEFHPWDPHKAAKDIEVGDYYFRRKNYVGAESRYREALLYKENDADATYKLAVCLDKMDRRDEARTEYEGYLRILPFGAEAANAKKAIERLKTAAASAKPNQ